MLIEIGPSHSFSPYFPGVFPEGTDIKEVGTSDIVFCPFFVEYKPLGGNIHTNILFKKSIPLFFEVGDGWIRIVYRFELSTSIDIVGG